MAAVEEIADKVDVDPCVLRHATPSTLARNVARPLLTGRRLVVGDPGGRSWGRQGDDRRRMQV
jgi:hypothetical protein